MTGRATTAAAAAAGLVVVLPAAFLAAFLPTPAAACGQATTVGSGPATTGTVTMAQVAQAAYDAGWRGPDLTVAVAVGMAESGNNPSADNSARYPLVRAKGEWQVSQTAHPEFAAQWADGSWANVAVNARMAYRVWQNAGGWAPWTTYTSGAYQQFLPAAYQAVGSLGHVDAGNPQPPDSEPVPTGMAAGGSCGTGQLPPLMPSGPLGCVLPVAGVLTSRFGPRAGSVASDGGFHPGIDLAAPLGTPIVAACPGVVATAGPASGYGNFVQVMHAGGLVTGYGHMRYLFVQPGQPVAAGQVIALVGCEGSCTGPHLHFEVRTGVWGQVYDPLPFLAVQGVHVPGA